MSIRRKTSVRLIAEMAGVSPATVSRTLSASSAVSPATRERILAVAHNLGYRRVHPRKRAVLIVSQAFLRGEYDRDLTNALLGQCKKANLGLMIVTGENLSELDGCLFDGFFSISYTSKVNHDFSERYNCPLICFNNFSRHYENIYSVNSDETGAIESAVSYFEARGHRRIGLLCFPGRYFSHMTRIEQFKRSISKHPGLVPFFYKFEQEPDYDMLIHQLLTDGVSAFLLPHEGFQLQFFRHLAREGKKIPDDFSLIAWEDRKVSRHMTPPVTTFSQDYQAMAKAAVELFCDLLNNNRRNQKDILIPYRFNSRGSVAAI